MPINPFIPFGGATLQPSPQPNQQQDLGTLMQMLLGYLQPQGFAQPGALQGRPSGGIRTMADLARPGTLQQASGAPYAPSPTPQVRTAQQVTPREGSQDEIDTVLRGNTGMQHVGYDDSGNPMFRTQGGTYGAMVGGMGRRTPQGQAESKFIPTPEDNQ